MMIIVALITLALGFLWGYALRLFQSEDPEDAPEWQVGVVSVAILTIAVLVALGLVLGILFLVGVSLL